LTRKPFAVRHPSPSATDMADGREGTVLSTEIIRSMPLTFPAVSTASILM
jgi:hypothetical protein